MIRPSTEPVRLRIAEADAAQRSRIYELRHAVYARELGQHPVNDASILVDDLDGFNHYITAAAGDDLAGFVSITPTRVSPQSKLSIDKYVDRAQLPFAIDEQVYEVRLLTVMPEHRHGPTAGLLMWAALRWIESRGGRRIVAIGRREVMDLYTRVGFRPAGVQIASGAVTFELMYATTDDLDRRAEQFNAVLNRYTHRVDWQLGVPYQHAPSPASSSSSSAPSHVTPSSSRGLQETTDECYHGGAFFEAIGVRFDALHRRREVINADVLDAWFDPSPRVVAAVRDHLPWLMRTSPPTGCEGFIEAIAERRGVDPACVLPGGGSSDLIFLALRHTLTPASRVLILDPMYGEYAHVLEKVIGCRVDRFELDPEDHYAVDVPSLMRTIAAVRYDQIVLVNPNSPTGQALPRHTMARLLAAVPETTGVWIDETYVDYVGADQSLESHAAASRNVIVCKSMSKVYALSGMRCAYLVGPRGLIAGLRRQTPPWAVSLPGQVAAVAALDDVEYYRARWRHTHLLREQLSRSLRQRFGWTVHPGVANFVLCDLPASAPTAAELADRTRRRGLFIRDASTMGHTLGDRAVRLAVKDPSTTRRMIDILGQCM